ncbi:MAG TPA: hypothetical protein VGP46_13210, partial [Acidimicrobiales bacterium]|nr:hypothetical protein [Acidimicrobiales bacterium]
SQLTAVSCPTTTGCTTIGYYESSPTSQIGIIEARSGSKWSVVANPSPHFIADALSCTAPGSCMLVGTTDAGSATASEGALSP